MNIEGTGGGSPDDKKSDPIVDFKTFKESKERNELNKGSEFTIPDLGGAANFGYKTLLPWVDIVRGETGHGTRDSGIIEEGKTITVMGISNEFGVLCRYNNKETKGGTELEDGSMFYIDKDELLFWTKLVELQEKKKQRMNEETKRILGEE